MGDSVRRFGWVTQKTLSEIAMIDSTRISEAEMIIGNVTASICNVTMGLQPP